MNYQKIILDFDGTIIYENSTRELEKSIITHIGSKKTRFLLNLLFIWKSNLITRILLFPVSYLLGIIDLRFFVFYHITKSIYKDHKKEITCDLKETLSINLSLQTYIANNYKTDHISILSNGIDQVINIISDYTLLQTSQIDKSGKLYLKSFRSKGLLLKQIKGSFLYFTDDFKELNYIGNISKTERKNFDNKYIYIVHIKNND